MELVPHRGTRGEFMLEMFARTGHVAKWLPHKRRVRWCRQARRLVDDHKSGARLAAAADVVALCNTVRAKALTRAREAGPKLEALRIVAERNPWLNFGVVAATSLTPASLAPTIAPVAEPATAPALNSNGDERPLYAVVFNHRRIPLTLEAMIRAGERDEADGAAAAAVAKADAALTAANGKARTAAEVHELLRLTISVQSDYASMFETTRIHTATCAHPERHNLLVSIVGYKPYVEMMKKQGRGKKHAAMEPVRKQHVDIFYAFHKAGFKPSARSFNVVQACAL